MPHQSTGKASQMALFAYSLFFTTLTPAMLPCAPPLPTIVRMSLTSAVAAANACVAASQGKKAAQLQLQTELNTDEEWEKFLVRDGLIVVDVYTDWCGPCVGMVGNLKKIKVELGGDNLHLAIAKADTIECLKRFRNRSEPTWMFISSGQLVEVIFGADAPRIARTIERELRNEELVRAGQLVRERRAPHELTPPEQEAVQAREKLLLEKKEKEAKAAEEARLGRREARARRLESHFNDICPAVVMPHAQKYLRKVSDALETVGVAVADKMPTVLGRESARVLAVEDPSLGTETLLAALAERPALALLLKKLPDREGDVIELTRRALCGDGIEPEEGARKTVLEELSLDSMPGLFVPADRHQRAAALDLLFPKMVSSVVDPPTIPEPPHVAMIFGAWQRRAVLSTAAQPAVVPRVLRYGFFADGNVEEPRLMCKTVEQYELRPEKDFGETIIVMVTVGVLEPALQPPGEPIPDGPPDQLMKLGPLHVSQDFVVGADECARLFPPGYSVPEVRAKPKGKKKKKKRQDNKEQPSEEASDAHPVETPEGDSEDTGVAGETAEGDDLDGEDSEGDKEDGDEDKGVDKATSPPPLTPH